MFTKLFLFFVVVFTVVSNQGFSSEIPGYIGFQSFRLSDDSGLYDFDRRLEEAKREVARMDERRDQFEGQIRNIERDRENKVNEMNQAIQASESAKQKKNQLQSRLTELNKDPATNQAEIAKVQSELSSQDQIIASNNQRAGGLKLELGNINTRLDQIRRDFEIVNGQYEESRHRLGHLRQERERYLSELISQIQYINRQGADNGLRDGSYDGASLAASLGQSKGSSDGDHDGYVTGTLAGEERDYKRGADQGERDGSARAKLDGERDGKLQGTVAGNENAADREGTLAGENRADKSDAKDVGIAQGKVAGLKRAEAEGSVAGNNIGENETVNKFESANLENVSINGAFAGSFNRRTPDYPGDFNGTRFNPNTWNSRDLLKRAYYDGYVDQYRQYTRYEFLRRIDGEYNQVYDRFFNSAYNEALNKTYQDQFDEGRKVADKNAYNRDYPIIKKQVFDVYFDMFNNNPDRGSSEYKSTYASSEKSGFARRYENIRRANFDRVELEVFNANIKGQTEKYRQIRIAEVTKIYQNNAILMFVSSEIFDGGIDGVAKLDGVFQPGETTLHNIVLKNFGLKSALNVSVILDNGEVVQIPEIKAQSIVKIIGAGKTKIASNAAIGSEVKTKLKVVSKLTSNDIVEAIHFDSMSLGELKSADIKSTKVNFPLSLSGLSLASGELLKNFPNKLKITLSNNSKRAYTGDIHVELTTNASSNIISKVFDNISSLQGQTTLESAEVLVTDEKDVYRDLEIEAKVFQNQVLIGVLNTNLRTMAKAQYLEKSGAKVLVFNANKNLRAGLDALSTLGGTENVSVLDLSLPTLNATTLANGLSEKVILISDDENGSNVKSLNAFIAKSKQSAFVFIDEANSGLKSVLTLSSLKDAAKLSWDKRQVFFSNPFRAEGVLKSSAFLQSDLRSFENDLNLATNLALSAQNLTIKLKKNITRDTFMTPNDLIKVYNLKSLSEIVMINKAYSESGGVFSRDKKWARMIEDDQTLFINAVKSSVAKISEENVGLALSVFSMKDTVLNAISYATGISSDIKTKINSTTTGVLNDLESNVKKELLKFDTQLYNKAYAKFQIHRPFFIEAAPRPPM